MMPMRIEDQTDEEEASQRCRLACLFARLLRCENRYIARYAPVFTP
jgi:hypothetical protein